MVLDIRKVCPLATAQLTIWSSCVETTLWATDHIEMDVKLNYRESTIKNLSKHFILGLYFGEDSRNDCTLDRRGEISFMQHIIDIYISLHLCTNALFMYYCVLFMIGLF